MFIVVVSVRLRHDRKSLVCDSIRRRLRRRCAAVLHFLDGVGARWCERVCLFVSVALGNYSSPHVMFVVVVVCVARHVMHSH